MCLYSFCSAAVGREDERLSGIAVEDRAEQSEAPTPRHHQQSERLQLDACQFTGENLGILLISPRS